MVDFNTVAVIIEILFYKKNIFYLFFTFLIAIPISLTSAGIWSALKWWSPKSYGAGVDRSSKACTFCTRAPHQSFIETLSATTSSSQAQRAAWRSETSALPLWREPPSPRASSVRYQCSSAFFQTFKQISKHLGM